MTLTTEQITAYITQRMSAPVAMASQLNLSSLSAKYRFDYTHQTYILTIGLPNSLNPRQAHLARAEYAYIAGENNLTGKVIDIDPQPNGLPEGRVAYIREYVPGRPMTRADYIADPLRLAHMLRSLHLLGATAPFQMLKLPDIEHPQLRALKPLTPRSALAWYLPQYADEYPYAANLAQYLASLWVQLDKAFGAAIFEYNMPVMAHNDFGWHNAIVTPAGDWQIIDFEKAVIDDPIVDFVWPLDTLDDATRRTFLAEYGIPDFAHGDWLEHWRLRYIYRNLETATNLVYTAFAGLTGRDIDGFTVTPSTLESCYNGYYEFAGSAATALGFSAPQPAEWT